MGVLPQSVDVVVLGAHIFPFVMFIFLVIEDILMRLVRWGLLQLCRIFNLVSASI